MTDIATIEEVCSLVTDGTHYTPVDVGQGTPFLTVKDVTDWTLDFSDCSFITDVDYEAARAANSAPRRGDVLFSKDGTVGKVHVVNTDRPFAVLSSIAILRPNPSRVDAAFLGHALRSPIVLQDALARKTGSAIRRIVLSDLRKVLIPCPPLPEQRQIADILDRVQALLAQRGAMLATQDDLAQAIFLDLVTGPASEQWPVETIAQIADSATGSVRTGPFGSQLLHSEFVADGVAVLGIDNVVANTFRWAERRFISETKYRALKRYTVRPGDVLITIMGTCGRCAVVPDDVPLAINTKHLCCITLDPEKCLSRFLHAYFLWHPLARRYLDQAAKGAIMSGLNMSIIKNMPVRVPPLSLQHELVRRLSLVDGLRTSMTRSLGQLDTLLASLQVRAFEARS